MFAADEDFSKTEAEEWIGPYFEAVKDALGGSYRIGAYGSGLVLSFLLERGLIEVPWLSMSRAFRGTEEFFYANDWALRQIPPEMEHAGSGIGYDRNILRWSPDKIGCFSTRGTVRARRPEAVSGAAGGPIGARIEVPRVYVKTEGLNLRPAPNHDQSLRELTICDELRLFGVNPADARWLDVEHEGTRGVVFSRYVRPPEADSVEALLRETIDQWIRFKKGAAYEKSDPYYKYVGEMWHSIGEPYDGRSTYVDDKGVVRDRPWSAAFISFVVRNAGPEYGAFKFSARHSEFVHDAIQARFKELTDRPFWGYPRDALQPRLGDIIQRNRSGNNDSFDYAENHSQYESHSDIVVEVTERVVRVMGGNVGDTVATETGDNKNPIQEYELNADGFLAKGQSIIAVLRNRSAEVLAA